MNKITINGLTNEFYLVGDITIICRRNGYSVRLSTDFTELRAFVTLGVPTDDKILN